ncbi:hypothetical protein FRACYDRAFT_240639 [Fragilariopsis cylindrus CCMP1102]|uniref:Uncharacterized protein n=1 Tax=Fragilariopsis cylindrus CCMP1102 TaxID=635003 RepID=A0A1E7FDQ8_9STRA|nr:hypothetical protein FRACYDRAFT_240639 [Fragilariopsis cylindrus CCMP1102]|eukprot:OEU15943.1 hypothetical protein FRACYDRAFT_240639 [Fragilariopsis cylindrus CCMP1102]
MWETGEIVTLTLASSTGQQHELDLLVDASFANGKSRPLLLSLPSRPFARLRPPFSSRGNNQQKRKRKSKQNPEQKQSKDDDGDCSSVNDQEVLQVPIAIDGKAVGKEALWLVHSAGVVTVTIESVAHPGIYLSVDDCGRVTCLKKCSNNAMYCVFHAKIAAADPINNGQIYSTSTSSNSNSSCENKISGVSLPPVVRCKLPEPQQHPRLSSTIVNDNSGSSSSNSVICDGSVCGSTTTTTTTTTTKHPPWQKQTNDDDADSSSSNGSGPLSKDQILQFAQDGYLVLRNVVPPLLWQPAAASVFGALGKPFAVVHGGDGSNSGHKAAGKLAGHKKRRGVDLADAIEISQTSAQVALRFPEPSLLGLRGVAVPEEDGLWAKVKPSCTIRGECTERQQIVYDDDDEKAVGRWQEKTKGERAECEREVQANNLRELGVKWHIDGTRQRQYHGFTLLMGVALSDCGLVQMVDNGVNGKTNGVTLTSELEGQLCVWPLSHWDLQGMGRMCEPKPVDYASLVKAGAPLNDYEYFDYLDTADAISRERSMKYLDAAAADSIPSEEEKSPNCDVDDDNKNINFARGLISSHDNCAKNTTDETPICSSSPGGYGPVIVALKAGDGVLLHCETAHAATPNFNPNKVRAMAYYRLRLLPCVSTTTDVDDKRKFRGDADRKEMRDLYEWGMEHDRILNSSYGNNATKEEDFTGDNMLTPDAAAIAAAKQMLASLWPDLGGVSEVLSEYLDGMVNQQQQQQVDTTNKIDTEGVEGLNNEENDRKLGLRLLRMCNLHPRSSMCNADKWQVRHYE